MSTHYTKFLIWIEMSFMWLLINKENYFPFQYVKGENDIIDMFLEGLKS